jgi:rSAM/selenodomain-associated transferase 2
MNTEISIVIPAWNEELELPRTLEALEPGQVAREIIVVDAGSTDRTVAVAQAAGARIVQANRRQRAHQLNLGAQSAAGNILLFLHADTLLPPGGLGQIVRALSCPSIGGGAFARRFDSSAPFLKMTALLTDLRNGMIGWHLGDQAMFVRRDIFFAAGGFPPFDRFEDLEFSRRLGRCTRLVTLRPPVVTSARRFEKFGTVRQTARDFHLTMRYLRGAPAALYYNGEGPEKTNTAR